MNKLLVLSFVPGLAMLAPPPPYVDLQAATPGVQQTGHINISGTVRTKVVRSETVFGDNTAASGIGSGGDFRAASTSGRGVFGFASAATGSTAGGWFQTASIAGRGVFGVATSAAGSTYGGYFESKSNSGIGAYGFASATSGPAYGVSGVTASSVGRGVNGLASATSGSAAGVYGSTYAPNGNGVVGISNSSTGTNNGVYGVTNSGPGAGVRGFSPVNGYGGFFESTNGTGLVARGKLIAATFQCSDNTVSNHGVQGWVAAGSANGSGVYGVQNGSPNGYAVYSNGNFGASGTKAFRIDHPFQPEHKYLLHYSMEGPDVLNVYTGNVKTDARGYATIELPYYFESINRDPRYTLTVIDDSDRFVMAKVTQKVRQNRFVIRTSEPRIEVSWEVKAIRNDRHIQMYGAPVEVTKTSEEQGKYERPELFGYGNERATVPNIFESTAGAQGTPPAEPKRK